MAFIQSSDFNDGMSHTDQMEVFKYYLHIKQDSILVKSSICRLIYHTVVEAPAPSVKCLTLDRLTQHFTVKSKMQLSRISKPEELFSH